MRRSLKARVIRTSISALAWLGALVLYYVLISLFFDTPVEHQIRASTALMREQYDRLEERFDSLHTVMENVSARDRNVFGLLFESEPYDYDSQNELARLSAREQLIGRSDRRLRIELAARLDAMEAQVARLQATHGVVERQFERAGTAARGIPSIQPVLNQQLTLLTTSYGMRIHPFYRTLQSHQGVDYAVPEGSRVFATADGRVRDIAERSTQGKTVVIDHAGGYQTSYSHLMEIGVQPGQEVQRGQIIALSGDTGLSLAPHLHYEVRKDGMRVDPIHYFFVELSPEQYQRIMHIAQSGMQAFD